MTLTNEPSYTAERCYVLKLHRDARPRQGEIKGRLEHVSTGDWSYFASGAELLAAIATHDGGRR